MFLALHSRRLAIEILTHDTIEYQSIKVNYSRPTEREIKKLLYWKFCLGKSCSRTQMLIHHDEIMLGCVSSQRLNWKARWLQPRGWTRNGLARNLRARCLLPVVQWQTKKKSPAIILNTEDSLSFTGKICFTDSIPWIELYKKN